MRILFYLLMFLIFASCEKKNIIDPPQYLPSIEVVSPNGNEIFNSNDICDIKWISRDINKIRISFIKQNSSELILIADSINSDIEKYQWVIPNMNSSKIMIIINSLDNPEICDSSDQFLFINGNPELNLLKPNGNEIFNSNDICDIKWISQDINKIRISFIKQNSSELILIADSINSDIEKYQWVIPNMNSSKIMIIINSLDNPEICDSSDQFLFINGNPELNLLKPNGDEIFNTSSKQYILWESFNIEQIKIFYSINNSNNRILIADSIDADTGSFEWITPDFQSSNMKIIIESNCDPLLSDISDGYFELKHSQDVLEANKYYPMHIGDEWIFQLEKWDYWTDSTTISDTLTIKIVGDTLMPNNHTYYVFTRSSEGSIFRRIDSSKAILYVYSDYEDHEYLLLNSKDNTYSDYGFFTRIEQFSFKYINFEGTAKTFERRSNLDIYKLFLMKDLGMIHEFYDDRRGSEYNWHLLYAKINGTEFGNKP